MAEIILRGGLVMAKLRAPGGGDQKMEEISMTLPSELVSLLKMAASRVAFWEDGEPNVSKYVLSILERHREVIEREAQPEMRI